MAVRYWDYGAASGDWQTAANWSDDTKPLADDEIIFDSRATTPPTEGMLDSESGATAECTYDLLHFKKGYTGGVGSATEPLCCAPDKIIIDGSGTYYILCGKDNQSTDAAVPTTIINNKDATVYLYSNANDGANLCKFTDVYMIAGTLYVAFYSVDTDDQGCYVQNLYVTPKNNQSSNATVYIEKDAYDVLNSVAMNIYQNNGTVVSDSQAAIWDMRAGTSYYGSEPKTGTAVVETDMNITELRLHGGTFYWEPDDSGDDAYIGDLWIFGGTFDASGDTSPDRAKILGNGEGHDIYLFSGGTMEIRNNRGNITLATNTQLLNFGGTFNVDNYTQLLLFYNLP